MKNKDLSVKIGVKPVLAQINAVIETDVNGKKSMDESIHICNIEWDKFQRMLDVFEEHCQKQEPPTNEQILGRFKFTPPADKHNFAAIDYKQKNFIGKFQNILRAGTRTIVVINCPITEPWGVLAKALSFIPYYEMKVNDKKETVIIKW